MSVMLQGLSQTWLTIQGTLFPWLKEELGELSAKQQQLVTVLEVIRLEQFLSHYGGGCVGRPLSDRVSIASAFVAKVVYDLSTTRLLLDRLASDITLRRLCGWERLKDIPSESTFSRAFAEFSESQLPGLVHESLIVDHLGSHVVGHVSRDSTAIPVREKPRIKVKPDTLSPAKRGRPKKGEERPKEKTRLERQAEGMALHDMLADLPRACDVGTKQNSKGKKESWIGYKLHIDSADGGIPVSCLLSSASMHDSQAAIPLAHISTARVAYCYDLMDSAYDADLIKVCSQQLGHVPIIDTNPRRDVALKNELKAEAARQTLINLKDHQKIRYNERSNAERVNGRLKDEFGGRHVRVKGHKKVMCHLMFGVIALTVDQLLRWVQ